MWASQDKPTFLLSFINKPVQTGLVHSYNFCYQLKKTLISNISDKEL